MEDPNRIQIWFFIGALVLVYGILIFGAGIYYVLYPPAHQITLYQLHPDIWWGALLTILGAVYCIKFRPAKKAERS